MVGNESSWAWCLARSELEMALPRRWAHSVGVARKALDLSRHLTCDSRLLAASAILHDVGYSPNAAVTGFHPLDGARFLRDEHHADERLARLVANHTFALLEAEERGLREQLAVEFPILDDQVLVDALTFCDITTSPDGTPTTAANRIAEIVGRYGPNTVVGKFIQRAEPEILAAVSRIDLATAAHPR
ncbi:HD domain-containing protein [Nocardia sp. NPDC056000]|uniref:HD domain-containing protein n=1 Tax=Nocardia sp. NPDC056000 TaxID=3345674 RepID=UPI0035DE6A98